MLSGTKKLILLLAAPTTEQYNSIASLLSLLNIQAIDVGYCCDLKMVLILLGKQAASSKFCCPFCVGCSLWLDSYTLITIGSLWADYQKFVEAGSVVRNAMKFHNVIHPPLITGPDHQLLLGDTFLFPEHHGFTRITSKLVKEIEKNVFNDSEEGTEFMN